MSTDYSTLTDGELNRLVAERLGHEIDIHDMARIAALDFGKWTLKLNLRPDALKVSMIYDEANGFVTEFYAETEARARVLAWLWTQDQKGK